VLGMSPEGVASRADVTIAGVSIAGVCSVDSATSLTGADSTTAAVVATGALEEEAGVFEVAGADEAGAVDSLLPLRPMQAKLIPFTLAGLRTSASSVHSMST
jgi:hypothetical protein